MCGIAGFVSNAKQPFESRNIITQMIEKLSHRGPDKQGFWLNEENNIALGHSRLSILDLTASGHQPMVSNSGRFVLIFNGEIYNHLDLRKKISGISWKGFSDTETLVEAIDRWGLKNTLDKLVGMFAFGLLDRASKKLFLARDRFGEKPLYYGLGSRSFFFASELGSLSCYPDWEQKLNTEGIHKFLKFGYVPTPLSIWENVFKLPPGCYLEIEIENFNFFNIQPKKYWDIAQTFEQTETLNIDKNEILHQLEVILVEAVSSQMQSDVPVGVFLSGGIDSSLIASIAQSISNNSIDSFSIGFENKNFDESNHAKSVANYIGTNHHQYTLSKADALEIIPRLPKIYSEPFADSSQIPTYFVSKLAKNDVGVCLTGDGGDEIFGGYNRYTYAPQIWRKAQLLPKAMRLSLSAFLKKINPETLKNLRKFLPKRSRVPAFEDQMKKIALILRCESLDEVYETLISNNFDAEIFISKPDFLQTWSEIEYQRLKEFPTSLSPARIMMFRDITSYLCDDILTKVDRASMALSLETRAPFLDYRVATFAMSLPSPLLIEKRTGKKAIREILKNYIPENLVARPKQGFAIPLSDWLKGPLKGWAEELLNSKEIKDQGIFDQNIIQKKWNNHLEGRENCQNFLWAILSFQSWQESHKL